MSNKNFKGSVELISGITPKGGADFPLVDAEDIIIYEGKDDTEGMRLPDKLKEIGISEQEKTEIQESIFKDSRFTNLNSSISENATNITKLNTKIDEDNDLLKIQYNEAEAMLYLYEGETLQPGEDGNVLASTPIKGGGGAASLNYTLSMQRIGERNLTFLRGSSGIVIKYRANFTNTTNNEPEDEFLTFNLTITNASGNKRTETFKANTNQDLEYDITKLLTLGDNVVKISTSYSETFEDKPITISSSTSWNVKIVNLEIESDFNDTLITKADREISIPITIKGDLNKTLHWSINEEPFNIYENITQINYTHDIKLPSQRHGSCSVEVYVSAKINENEIKSSSLYFDVIRAEEGNNEPIIRAVPTTDKREQYTTIPISFLVYQEGIDSSSIELKVMDGENQEFYKTQEVGAKEEFWYYTPMTGGTKTLSITCEDTVKTLIFEIKDFPYVINPPVSSGLELDFNPEGRTNQDSNYNEFNYNGITWTLSDNFNWKSGGWQVDENNATYFCIKAGTSATFNYKMFERKDIVSATGAEFKVIFKTTNVANPNATWLSCLGETEKGKTVGLQMNVHEGYVYSSLNSLEIPYSEEDVIEFDMNITPFNNSNEKNIPMIMTYEDGTPVQPIALTDISTTLTQENPSYITIGSSDCDIHIYRIKAYSNFLTEKEILNNFIADAPSGSEKANRFVRNQIYNNQGVLTPESVAEACPDLRVIKITAPRFTKGKLPETGWDKVSNTTIEMIYKNGGPEFNWIATNCQHTGQGTSSNGYGQAGRNIDLIMNKSGVSGFKPSIVLDGGQGETVSKVALSENSVPVDYFNIKVNIASSENANNALLQKRYDRYLPYLTGADARDPKAKTTMEFFNCVIFVKETGYNELTKMNETKVEFDDGLDKDHTEFHFYGIGNIGDSKKTDDTRTSDPEDPNEFCVEIMDWNRALATFPVDTMTIASKYNKKDENGNIISYKFIVEENLGKSEEDAEPKLYEKTADGSYELTKDTQIDIDNIDKYYIDILLNDDFSEDYTYGFRYLNDDEDEAQISAAKAKWIEFYRFLTRDLTTNGEEDPKKVEEWKSEFKNWFIEDAAYFYYLYTLRYTMVDNRAKNSFWHYGKVATTNEQGELEYATDENGDYIYKFDFWDYDNDTSLGIDNAGKLEMTYGVEDNDLDPTVAGGDPDKSPTFFRGASSTFFQRLVKYFSAEIRRSYSTYESKNSQVFDSEHLIKEFDDWQSQFPEELWRLDYERKYKRPYVNGSGAAWDYAIPWSSVETDYLVNMMNGKKKYQRRQFERNQDFYMSSKFIGMRNSGDKITLRGAGDLSGATGLAVPQDTTLYITPYMNMYINLNSSESGGNPYQSGVMVKAGETRAFEYDPAAASFEFNVIYGASRIQSLGDLSKMYLQRATLTKGTKLKEVILGNSTQGYSNGNFTTLGVSKDNAILEKLNIENLTKLTGSIEIDSMPNLKEFYAKGSSLTSVTFAFGGLISKAHLPETLDTLRLKDLYFLSNDNLILEKPENLLELVVDNTPNINSLQLIEKATKLSRVRITNIDWYLENSALLNRLLKCKGVSADGLTPIDQSVLTGTVRLNSIRESEILAFKTAWPDLELIYDEEDIIPQYTVNFWRDIDNPGEAPIYSKLFDEMYQLTAADDPSQQLIEEGKLFKESTAQYDYTFKTWTPNFTGYVNKNLDFYGTFNQIDRYYDVTWYKDKEKGIVMVDTEGNKATVRVKYGDPAIYNEEQFGLPSKNTFAEDNKYHLFGGWDKPTGYITGDTKVYPIWETSTANIPEGTDSEELTPAQINALSNITNGLSTFIDDGDKIKLQTGYMPDYDGIVLIDNPVIFNGSGENVIQTDYKLFDEDKSFVLAIDFEAHMPGSGISTLVSCGGASGGKGFRLYSLNSASKEEIYPQIQWKQSGTRQVGFNDPSAQITHRDICVIKHIKGDSNLYVFTNNRKSLSPAKREEPLPGGATTGLISHNLCFGAQSTDSGYSMNNLGTGIIHYAKLWFNDLDDSECEKICSWIYDELTFSNCGSHIYKTPSQGEDGTIYEGESYSDMSFVADKLLDLPNIYDKNSNFDGGWTVSDLRTWLNTKVFAGLSIPWQQIIKPVAIKSLYGYTSSGSNNKPSMNKKVVITEDKLYIPATIEVDSSVSGHYLLEKSNNIYSGFPTQEARIKQYPTGEINSWWLRTPSDTSYGYNEIVTPTGLIRSSWTDNNTDINYNGGRTNENGIIVGFSIGEVV